MQIFYLHKIGRKLHKEHSFWKEKQKSMSLNGRRLDQIADPMGKAFKNQLGTRSNCLPDGKSNQNVT